MFQILIVICVLQARGLTVKYKNLIQLIQIFKKKIISFLTMTSFNEWIDMKINDGKIGEIDYIEYSEFSNVEKVGEGAFGIVKSADWISYGIKIALKTISSPSVDEKSMTEFVKEVNIIIMNIIL
jgi:serine/threonine protein kinase